MKNQAARIDALKEKHKQLDEQIKQDYKNYIDDLEIEILKKQKLRIKDELKRLET